MIMKSICMFCYATSCSLIEVYRLKIESETPVNFYHILEDNSIHYLLVG